MTTTHSIEDVFPDPGGAKFVALLACSECGQTGHCYSDSDILDERQYWDCEKCGTEAAKHDVVLKSRNGEVIRQ